MGQSKIPKKKKGNKIFYILVTILVLVIALVACAATNLSENGFSSSSSMSEEDYTQIKFSELYEIQDKVKDVSKSLKLLNGQKVKMNGYMAEQSPVDESFIYLVAQPYVVCPFCTVGDTTKLEVMQVVPKTGTIKFRTTPVTIYGTLEVQPAIDSFGYTTQFRIVLDKLKDMEEENINEEMDTYYRNLNEGGMILDIQTLQMDLDYLMNPETFKLAYGTTDPVKVIDSIKADSSYDYSWYKDTYFNGYPGIEDISAPEAFIMYIEECPEIIKSIPTPSERYVELSEELIKIYNDEIALMKEVMPLLNKIQTTNMSNNEKIEIYNKLTSYCDKNLNSYYEFTAWNKKLRD